MLQRDIYFSDVFPQELKIHIENEKDVINAEVNGEEARQTCVDERVAKQNEFFQPIKISNLKNNSYSV